MTFGKRIKQLRLKANMTQEQLAEVLSISGQAVSRWENDGAMPDISLLVVLANMFGVTTDYLLGVDITKKDANIRQICAAATAKGRAGFKSEAVEIARVGLKEYPQSYALTDCLQAQLLGVVHTLDGDERAKTLREVVELCERILDGSTDEQLRCSAIDGLCYAYTALGENAKAVELASAMPDAYLNRKSLLARCTVGSAQYDAKRDALVSLIEAAVRQLILLNTRLDDGEWALSGEDAVSVYKNALTLIDMLCPDGDYGEYYVYRVEVYARLAATCLDADDVESGLAYLRVAAELAVEFDDSYDAEGRHTSPLLCGRTNQTLCFDSPQNQASSLLDFIKSQPVFEKLSATDGGKSVLRLLEENSGK